MLPIWHLFERKEQKSLLQNSIKCRFCVENDYILSWLWVYCTGRIRNELLVQSGRGVKIFDAQEGTRLASESNLKNC